jgi:hypothetical protein
LCCQNKQQQQQHRFNALPAPHRLANYDEDEQSIQSTSILEETYNAKTHKAWDQNSEQMFEQNLTWADVRWLKQVACKNLPLVVKGIMTAEDAHLALVSCIPKISLFMLLCCAVCHERQSAAWKQMLTKIAVLHLVPKLHRAHIFNIQIFSNL